MKTTIKNKSKSVSFGNLDVGATFMNDKHGDDVFLKICNKSSSCLATHNAFNLTRGYITAFYDGSCVTPVECELIAKIV